MNDSGLSPFNISLHQNSGSFILTCCSLLGGGVCHGCSLLRWSVVGGWRLVSWWLVLLVRVGRIDNKFWNFLKYMLCLSLSCTRNVSKMTLLPLEVPPIYLRLLTKSQIPMTHHIIAHHPHHHHHRSPSTDLHQPSNHPNSLIALPIPPSALLRPLPAPSAAEFHPALSVK